VTGLGDFSPVCTIVFFGQFENYTGSTKKFHVKSYALILRYIFRAIFVTNLSGRPVCGQKNLA
jgi:hypothetical protein